ncbi:SH3 domain-containing protein [Sodalinema gerasimenkoae]|uniref:SH3 domain-containing protein n=1 Tax=Sodalinema gerasimenkoae TaxID=2862348 RepID=UPI001358F0B6|nr:SH3 domain-containing protein [Sodalinema gerasimenkoae]
MKLAGCLSVLLLTLPPLSYSSLAAPLTESPVRHSVRGIDPLCRQVSSSLEQGLSIRVDPRPDARSIANVAPNERLRLMPDAEEIRGPEGNIWLAVSFPAEGYVDNGPLGSTHLNPCEAFVWGSQLPSTSGASTSQRLDTPSQSDSGSSCRRVIQPEGLTVRQSPSLNGSVLGGVDVEETLRIRLPLRTIVASDGREWVEITAPFDGYVSNGFGDGVSNLGLCR